MSECVSACVSESNKCECEGGRASEGAACTANGAASCRSCGEGMVMSDDKTQCKGERVSE